MNGEGQAYGNLGIVSISKRPDYEHQIASRRVTMQRPSSTTRRTWRSQRRWATGRGRAWRTRTSATRIGRRVTSARPSSTTGRTWRLQRRWATGREGRAHGNLSTCHMHLNEYVKAVAYFEAQHVMSTSLKLAHEQSEASSAQHGCPHPSRPRSSPGPCCWC